MDNRLIVRCTGWAMLMAILGIIQSIGGLSNAFGQTRKRMPEPINLRDHIEYSPSISADGKTLIFQSDRYGTFVNAYRKVPRINSEGNQQVIDDKLSTQFFGIYEARLHPGGQWMKPEPIQIINRFDNSGMTPLIGGPSISYDGNYLFFFANFPTKSGFGREDIYYCIRQKDGWGSPVNMGPLINTAGYEGFPSISADGRKLYFVRENLTKRSQEGQTCYRIMVSEKGRDGQWKRPIELPPPVNLDCEKAPRILADSRTIVYSSIKAKGSGDFDLYMSVLQEDGSWSEPKNLYYINSKRSDQSVAVSACGDLLYYISDGDIYTTFIPEELRPFKLAIVQGFVTDSLTGGPVSARVVVNEATTGQLITTIETNPADGRYTVLLPVTSTYRLTVNEKDFRTRSHTVPKNANISCDAIPKDFRLQSIRTETAAIANDIVIVTEKNEPPVSVTTPSPVVSSTAPLAVADTVAPRLSSQPMVDSVRKAKPPLLTITILVVDSETGVIVPNAQVSLTDETTQAAVTAVFDSRNQRFGVPVLPGTSLTIRATAQAYMITKSEITNVNSTRQVTIKLVKPKPSILTIKVFAMKIGQPLVSAVAVITSRMTGKSERFDLPEGQLERQFTSPDDLDIQVSAVGYTSVSRQMSIEVPLSGKFYEFDAELDKIPSETKPVAVTVAAQTQPKMVETPTASVSVASTETVTTKTFGVIEKGKSIRLNKIYFDQSSPVLRPESSTELDQLYDVLMQYPSLRIEIRGHTDNQGDFDLNTQLSRDRCQSVVDYLVTKGVRKNRLKAVGRGSLDPVAPNNNEENRKKNRRVEFVVL